MKIKYLFLSIFVFGSIVVEEVSQRPEIIPLYSWKLFSNVSKTFEFHQLEILKEEKQLKYTSLFGVSDGVSIRNKILISRLVHKSEEEKDRFVKELLDGEDAKVRLVLVRADIIDFYENKKIKEKNVLWSKKF